MNSTTLSLHRLDEETGAKSVTEPFVALLASHRAIGWRSIHGAYNIRGAKSKPDEDRCQRYSGRASSTMTIAPTTLIDFPREKNNKTGLRRPLDSHSMGPTNYSRLRCLVFKEQADSIWSPNGPKFVPPLGRTWVLATKVLYHRAPGASSESRTVPVSRSLG
jgi:hypothetical protein